MERRYFCYILMGVIFIFTISGCVVRTYKVVKERVDQDLTEGNRGYIFGEIPKKEVRKVYPATRTVRMVELELFPPIKFERMKEKEPKPMLPPKTIETEEAISEESLPIPPKTIQLPEIKETQTFQKYTVQKNDSLQKISLRFYGTTKKWMKIYEANKDILKSPDKIYPGQVINIPLENTLEETPQESIKKIK
ncbi:MAG: LysM peptidoglycan-binding domain-containing protein [Candidatus Omnitrophica bacterium]|nr:LysM peptidoglycan-binding domain-containing protein [Candidatus Omnitrophota bacterium]